MVGSTNHLERLDPGIAKRPSRFDRKYLFPEPDLGERVLYCEFWRRKLGIEDGDEEEEKEEEKRDGEVEFPEVLCKAIAAITDGFSFAYIQEAFVASLLAIAAAAEEVDGEGKPCDDVQEPLDLKFNWEGRWEELPMGGVMFLKDGDKDLDRFVLWREIKKQVKNLREEIETGNE
ncbi:MAG: hypothetical protein Q9218_008374, partial [Villophora microphyllina]